MKPQDAFHDFTTEATTALPFVHPSSAIEAPRTHPLGPPPPLPPWQRLLTVLSRSGRIGAPLIFSGPQGMEKRAAALELAKALNCLNGEGCSQCQRCRQIQAGVHPDVQVVDLAYQARFLEEGIADQRSLRIELMQAVKRTLMQKPFDARWKVTIIDDAHLLTPDASNTLLKLLEEPPPQTLLILITTHRDRLLATIRSRCQTFHFQGRRPQEGPAEDGLDATAVQADAERVWDQLASLTPTRWLALRRFWDRPGKTQRAAMETFLHALLPVARARLPANDPRLPETLRVVLEGLTAIRHNGHPRIVLDALSLQLHEILHHDPYLLRQ